MEELLQQFRPDLKRHPAQAALYHAWHRVWKACGPDLLPCYDIPGLPPDNLKLESLFGRLRRHQRRVSGRKSTRELRDFGQYQVLFQAESETNLLQQLRQVPLAEYRARRLCLVKLKPRVSSFTVCIATCLPRCTAWSTNMLPVGLNSQPAPACRRHEVMVRQSGGVTTIYG